MTPMGMIYLHTRPTITSSEGTLGIVSDDRFLGEILHTWVVDILLPMRTAGSISALMRPTTTSTSPRSYWYLLLSLRANTVHYS
jgi:hypothetical protein